jgi:ABC-2 type transport system permease protein
MSRILVIARTEFLGLVRSKFFILGIVVMPLLVLGLVTFLGYIERRVDRADRRLAVVDGTGELGRAIAEAAAAHNVGAGSGARRSGPHFLPELVDPGETPVDVLLLDLSDRVRRGELFAFVYIPAGVLQAADTPDSIQYYSENTSYDRLSAWLGTVLNEQIRRERLERAGLDPEAVSALITRVPLASFALVERQPDGTVLAAREVDAIQQLGVPMFFLVVMFMAIMSNAQHLINATIEEKISKISEVLLGSVSAFQLLAGKLLGIAAVSFVLAFVYMAGGVYSLVQFGRPDLIDPMLMVWFVVFLLCASLLFGSLFQALSSACSDLKDAQHLLQPAMMVLIMAYLASFIVLRAPDSPTAVALSFVPLTSPFAMMLRLALPPGPPLWQLLLAVVLLIGVTTVAVWVAGRIFRVGLLMQGKPPTLPEIVRWIGQ